MSSQFKKLGYGHNGGTNDVSSCNVIQEDTLNYNYQHLLFLGLVGNAK